MFSRLHRWIWGLFEGSVGAVQFNDNLTMLFGLHNEGNVMDD